MLICKQQMDLTSDLAYNPNIQAKKRDWGFDLLNKQLRNPLGVKLLVAIANLDS